MARRQDRVEAFNQLYSDTFAALLAYCRRRSRSAADADDAVAETYTIAWRRIDDALGADSPTAWLYGVAYRVLSNQYRSADRAIRLRTRLRQVVAPPPTEPADAVAAGSEVADVYRALAQLDPRDQELIRLAALEDLSHAEIAEAIGTRPKAVRSRLFRARRRLQSVLDQTARDHESTAGARSGASSEASAERGRADAGRDDQAVADTTPVDRAPIDAADDEEVNGG